MRTTGLRNTIGLLLALFLLGATAHAKTTYILAVDGLSYESFQMARSKGLFKEFTSSSGHISTFPSMTDLAWSAITKTPEIFGPAGRIRSVEAVYFNESNKAVEGDVRDYYRRLSQPKSYLNAFDYIFNPYVEGLMYFPTQELPGYEMGTVLSDMATASGPLITGYIGAIDSTAHTQGHRLYPVLTTLDEQIRNFLKTTKAAGDDFELILISDHGNVGQFAEGQKELELKAVEIDPVVKMAGLNFVQQLQSPKDLAMPLLALGSWAPVYFKNTKNIPIFISALLQKEWFDLSAQVIERSEEKTTVTVVSQQGEANIHYFPKQRAYYYEVKTGNPLGLPQDLQSKNGKFISLNASTIETASRQGDYPDSIIRLIQAARSPHFDFPDLIITLKDGFYLNNSLGKMTKMYRTHGSLTRRASLGLIASTSRTLPKYLRSEQILSELNIQPETLFKNQVQKANRSSREALETVRNQKSGVPTGAKDYSTKRIFQQMTKIVADSRPYFIVDEITSFLSALEIDAPKSDRSKMQVTALNPSKLLAKPLVDPKEIGGLTDLIIKNPDINELAKAPQVLSLKKKFGLKSESESLNDLESKKPLTLAGKRAIMKLYQVPFLLDQSLTIQEKSYIRETRDLGFAEYWTEHATRLRQSAANLTKMSLMDILPWKKGTVVTVPERLFAEIFKEKQLEDRIFPEPLESIYKSSPRKTTIVYIPGTYNAIFDREIFSLGLLSLQEDLGLRVLKAPVLSACASDVNAEILLRFLKEDQAKFIQRREAPPKYLLIGYSKGGVDALYSFVQDLEFTRTNVLGLVAVASPFRGSEVLEKTDLPFNLVNMLIDEKTPAVCKTDKTISSTGSAQAMNRFWRKNESSLVGLTRYFSLSFVSNPEDSHIFMKATKLIGRFDEDNDGVVTVTSSKFPNRLMPTDLGVVEGDHLSGILSSRFPQKAFMRALVTAVTELGIEEKDLSDSWRTQAIVKAAPKLIDNTYIFEVSSYQKTLKLRKYSKSGRLNAAKIIDFEDPYELNNLLLGQQKDPAATYEPKVQLPPNQLNFDPYQALDLAKLPDILATRRVNPTTAQQFKQGIDLSFNHSNMIFYRMDHQFSYESRTPVGADNNSKWGFESVAGADKTPWLALRSASNSIRLTTLAYRFRPSDFSQMDLSLKVTENPKGADPVKGGAGKDDASFQIWFSLRDLRGISERALCGKDGPKPILFGYYFGGEVAGQKREAGQVFENYYSDKNVVVTTLPTSYQLLLNSGNEKLGQVASFRQNLVADIKKAYPKLDVNQLEVIAITLQMDSNDTSSRSEAFMKSLSFKPLANDVLGKPIAEKQ